jgi:hypothetical protein
MQKIFRTKKKNQQIIIQMISFLTQCKHRRKRINDEYEKGKQDDAECATVHLLLLFFIELVQDGRPSSSWTVQQRPEQASEMRIRQKKIKESDHSH